MEISFANKVVLVAGGTGGLGRAVSLAFLNEGADVIVTYRRNTELRDLEASASVRAHSLSGHSIDVGDETAVQELIDDTIAKKGRLDVLVNAVGGFAGGQPLWNTDLTTVEQMLAINYRASFLLMRAAARAMLKQANGAIINIASKAALDHDAGLAAYAGSKAAALALIDSLAADMKGSGVRVNSVLPSIIDTEQNRKAMPKANFGKWPKPEEIARVILFLASDAAKLIHGAAIPVYGTD